MNEENKNGEVDHAASTADQTHKLSKDARGLGPLQGGQIRLGAIDAMAHRCNNRHYLPVFTKSKIWSVSRVSAVLIE